MSTLNKSDRYIYNLEPRTLESLELLYFDSATSEICKPVHDENEIRSSFRSLSISSESTTFIPKQNQDTSYYKSDLYRYNLKRSLNNLEPLSEGQFEELLEKQSIESLSGSESESDEGEANEESKKVESLMKNLTVQSQTQYPQEEEQESTVSFMNTKNPYILFGSSLLPQGKAFGIYKSLFTESQLVNGPLEELKNLSSLANKTSALFMIGGGHFAGAIISHTPMNIKGNAKNFSESREEQAVNVVVSKTFHRYTTRRKQGGSQSASDNARGKANSAGSSIRRYNEQALIKEVRELLVEWKSYLDKCSTIYIRANGASNRKILVGYEGCVLRNEDSRLRSFPFTTKRATTSELKRAWVELTYLAVADLPKVQKKIAKERSATPSNIDDEKDDRTPEQIEHEDRTKELIVLLKKQKAPKMISYLKQNKIDVNAFKLSPEIKYANYPTLLHYASANGLSHMVSVLLVSSQADPTIRNKFDKTAAEIASDENTRRAFQTARLKLGEDRWDWTSSKVAEAKSKEDFEKEDELEDERIKAEKQNLIKEQLAQKTEFELKQPKFSSGGRLGISTNIASDLSGLSGEQKNRILREQRARAAEARFKKLQSS
ncbi:hypothetical protein G9P44_002144 [Scheffersomyces stipitis]|nr:hypothetical protein G9P44_002144 [Scheffersomyces stipitis]